MSRRIKKKNSSSTNETSRKESASYDKNMYDHLRPENKARTKAKQAAVTNSNSLTKVYVISVVGIIVVGMVITGAFTGDINPVSNNNNNNGNPIITDGNNQFTLFKDWTLDSHSDINKHYHFFLTINIFGTSIPVPANLGIQGSKMHLMHTHDSSSKVHVELPSGYSGVPTLADLFAIWSDWSGQAYEIGPSSLMTQSGSLTLTSNGNVVDIENPGTYRILENSGSDEIISLALS